MYSNDSIVSVWVECPLHLERTLTVTHRSTVTKRMEMERKRKNMRNQALQWSQLLRPIIRMYSWKHTHTHS